MNLEFETRPGYASEISNYIGDSRSVPPGPGSSAWHDREQVDFGRNGVVILGSDLRVLNANPLAQTIAGRADGLALDGQCIRALQKTDDELLQKLIGQALSCTGVIGTMPLARLEHGRHYFIVVRALLGRPQNLADGMPAVLVVIQDPDRVPAPSQNWLRRLFGLTAAEVRLALQLFGGSTLAEAASALNISRATARVHLAHIFRKTRTARQAELIRLLMSYPWDELAANETEAALAS